MKQEFGKRIRDLREDMDLNQTKLGKEVNMTQRKISYIENGTYEPSIDDIISFCKFLNKDNGNFNIPLFLFYVKLSIISPYLCIVFKKIKLFQFYYRTICSISQ